MRIYNEIVNGLREVADRIGSKADLMRLLNAKKATLYRALDDEAPSLPNAEVLCEWLDKLHVQVAFPGEELDSYEMIPKVNAVAGAGASLETEGSVSGFYAFRNEFLRREGIHCKSCVMMQVRGDSMEPLIREGDTILIDQSDNVPQDGRIFVIGLGDELMVKKLQKIPGGWRICSENPTYVPIDVMGDELDTFRVYGRVRWFGRVL